MEIRKPHVLAIDGKKIMVYISQNQDNPIVYLHTFEEEGPQVYQALQEAGCPDFTLVAVSGLSWNHDMSPWAASPVTKKEVPCTGGAEAYLQVLTGQIISEVEKLVPGKVSWRGLAGYSLAGLFALYAAYRTKAFAKFASVSGSLWFPGLKEYIFSNEMKVIPEAFYFSLGDKECRTRNPAMKTVQERTEEIEAYYRGKGIQTIYELNPGTHFQDVVQRIAAGIVWML